MLMLLGAVAFMFIGKSSNYNLALQWHNKSLPILREQFSYVGLDDSTTGSDFEQTSYSEFTFYASGRQNCFYSLFKMEMLRRHCILSTCVMEKIQETQDVLTVDIPIRFPHSDPNQPSQIPIEFLLLKKSKVKQSYTQYEHFAQFVS